MSGAGLQVHPGTGLSGRFEPPGDKSITHRAYVLGLLADGTTRVAGPNPGADCEATLAAATLLGAAVSRAADGVTIEGTAGRLREPDRVIDCGNSGTALRLLAGVLAGRPLLAVLSGDDSLRTRPVARVVEPLRRMGAWLAARDGDRLPPLVVRGGALSGVPFDVPTPSAQVASAILLAGLAATGETSVRVAWGVRDHTARMLPAFGVPLDREDDAGGASRLALRGPATVRAASLHVPGDFSAAAFFLAAAAAVPGARVTAAHVGLNPTRTGLLATLEEMGARVERRETGREAGEPVGEVTVTGPETLRASVIPAARVPAMVDEIPAWAIAASAARGTSRLEGASELRVKETDRLRAIATNLRALGRVARESADGLEIDGGPISGGVVRSHHDHRIAMAFAVLGTRATGTVTIDDARSIATSFPGFSATLAALGARLTPGGGGAR